MLATQVTRLEEKSGHGAGVGHAVLAPVAFDALLLTASTPSQAAAFRAEVALRRARGTLPDESRTRVLVVCDPEGVRIGSGGATLAALHALLRSLPGSPSEQLTLLQQLRIGLLHSGGDSQRLPTASVRGKAFCGMPYASDDDDGGVFESTPLDFLFECLSRLCDAPGCIVAATDCLFQMPPDYPPIRAGTLESRGVVGVTIETSAALGSNHGVFVAGDGAAIGIRPITDIKQKASQSELAAAGAITERQTVLLDSGIIFLSPAVLTSLLALAETSPFNTCISGRGITTTQPQPTFRFELYTDILLPMNPSMDLPAYLSSSPPDPHYPASGLESARRALWSALHPFTCFAAIHPDAQFFHMGTMHERMEFMFSSVPRYEALRREHRFVLQSHAGFTNAKTQSASTSAAVLNCMFETNDGDAAALHTGSFCEYSHLLGSFDVAAGAVVSGVRSTEIGRDLRVPACMCVQETQLNSEWLHALSRADEHDLLSVASSASSRPPTVVSIFHADDSIKAVYTHASATFLARPFATLIQRIADALGDSVDALVDRIWHTDVPLQARTLWNARLFPILRSRDVVDSSDVTGYLTWMLRLDQQDDVSLKSCWSTWLRTPRLSFADILALSDVMAENAWRAVVAARVDATFLKQHLFEALHSHDAAKMPRLPRDGDRLLAHILHRQASARRAGDTEAVRAFAGQMDEWALSAAAMTPPALDIAARIMWIHSQLLRASCTPVAAIDRSHTDLDLTRLLASAQPDTWREHLPKIISSLAALREEADSHRIADLYESACATIGRCAVATPADMEYSRLDPSLSVGLDSVVSLRGCIRLDLFGGWTDTPPVCFEHGGCVLNVAVTLDSVHTIRAEASVQLAMPSSSSDDNAASILVQMGDNEASASHVRLSSLDDLRDFNQPAAPAALVKCALLAMRIVDTDKAASLADQLSAAYWEHKSSGSGESPPPRVQLRLKSWLALSRSVSHGTGLGVSSILAADLILLLARIFDRAYTPTAVSFLVLYVEQLLTTCGGWQDQVGGLWNGFKLTRSPRGLPLRLEVETVSVTPERVREFESHVLLLHTGTPRLAKNLLRTVVSGWATREASLVQLFDRLSAGAPLMATAVQQGDWRTVGRMLTEFGDIKRELATDRRDETAPPAQPKHVTELIARTKHLCFGASLAGAGGGGFLILFAPPQHHAAISGVLDEFLAAGDGPEASASFDRHLYRARVCTDDADGASAVQITVRTNSEQA